MKAGEKLAYPIDEAFELIGVTRTYGYALIARGELRTYKAGRRRLATRAALQECVANMEQAGQRKRGRSRR